MSLVSESPLAALVAEELERPAPAATRDLVARIHERHGDAVAAVLFYGSCLRKGTHEGVLDLYVIVDSYKNAYAGRWLAWGNALLPPNVFYITCETQLDDEPVTLRAKYGVLSSRDFEKLTSRRALHPYIWARFAQPALLVYVRDHAARDLVVHCAAQSIVTLVDRLSVFLPVAGRVQRFSLAALWQEAFHRTYGAELRPESLETVRAHYDADAPRYDEAARQAFDRLDMEDRLTVRQRGKAVEVERPRFASALGRLHWRALWPLCKVLAFLRLMKTATTFGDWLPYALWKLERHTGVTVALSERQRRHPLIFAWPQILRLFRKGSLR